MRRQLLVAWCLLAAVVFTPVARADEVYTYTGNEFNQWFNGTTCPPVCSLSGSFTLSSPSVPFTDAILGISTIGGLSGVSPVAYSFTDGVTILNQTNSSITRFELGAGITGPQWFIDISGGGTEFITFFNGSGAEANDEVIQGGNLQALLALQDFSLTPTSSTCSISTPCAGHPGTWTTPEPSSALLLCAGLLGLVGAFLNKAVSLRLKLRT